MPKLAEFEEKEYECFFNGELAVINRQIWSPGQVLEGRIGFDGAAMIDPELLFFGAIPIQEQCSISQKEFGWIATGYMKSSRRTTDISLLTILIFLLSTNALNLFMARTRASDHIGQVHTIVTQLMKSKTDCSKNFKAFAVAVQSSHMRAHRFTQKKTSGTHTKA